MNLFEAERNYVHRMVELADRMYAKGAVEMPHRRRLTLTISKEIEADSLAVLDSIEALVMKQFEDEGWNVEKDDE